ncbi:hypothetical protein GC173_05140 [bacterium]|nr:hypothetical protein [bacterium]
MKYIINVVDDEEEPGAVRHWATVEGLDGCFLAENSREELFQNAPGIIRDFIEISNHDGSSRFPAPTSFEFRVLVHARFMSHPGQYFAARSW